MIGNVEKDVYKKGESPAERENHKGWCWWWPWWRRL